MLPKSYRIKKNQEINAIFKNSKILKNSFLTIRVIKNNLSHSRFAFVVSKKISKNASERNKIRRRLIAAIKEEMKDIKKSTDNIIIAMPGVKKADFSEIKEVVKKCFKR